MTTTDIGILLIVLCVVLWAIMAALHRHTVQMEALKAQMQALLKAQQAQSGRSAEASRPPEQHDKVEPIAPHAPVQPTAALKTRHTFSK